MNLGPQMAEMTVDNQMWVLVISFTRDHGPVNVIRFIRIVDRRFSYTWEIIWKKLDLLEIVHGLNEMGKGILCTK